MNLEYDQETLQPLIEQKNTDMVSLKKKKDQKVVQFNKYWVLLLIFVIIIGLLIYYQQSIINSRNQSIIQQQIEDKLIEQDDLQLEVIDTQQEQPEPLQPEQDQEKDEDEIIYQQLKGPQEVYELVVPLSKDKEYREIRLENDIRVLMIHDPQMQYVELSLSWQNGNWNDEKNKIGASNLLQHMLSQAMPYNNYQSLYDCIDRLDGISDSYIDDIFTDFYLRVTSLDKMKIGLNMLSNLLIYPDFIKEKVDEEINEIKDEEQLKLQGDRWGFSHILQIISNKKHPMSRIIQNGFEQWVNKQEYIPDQLQQFWSKRFSSNLVSVVVNSFYELASVEDMVLNSEIQNIENKLKEQEIDFGKIIQKNKNIVVKYKCYTNSNTVSYLFTPINDQYRLLIYFISNQDANSLLYHLNKQQLSDSININIHNNVDKLISINFNSIPDISLTYLLINHFITYLSFLANQTQSELNQQAQQMNAIESLSFHFQSKSYNILKLSQNIQLTSNQSQLLYTPFIFNYDSFIALIDDIKSNLLIIISKKELAYNQGNIIFQIHNQIHRYIHQK